MAHSKEKTLFRDCMILRKKTYPQLLSIERIWDNALPDSATDLTYFKGHWLCAFKEAEKYSSARQSHIRIISSADGIMWSSRAVLLAKNFYLSDPSIAIIPHQGLIMSLTAIPVEDPTLRQSYVTFSTDGRHWSPIQPILKPHEWLGRIAWHQDKIFAIAYAPIDEQQPERGYFPKIMTSSDGIQYQFVTSLDLPKNATEGGLSFFNQEEMVALFNRPFEKSNYLWIGRSQEPFYNWKGELTSYQLEKFNFIISHKQIWIVGAMIVPTPYGIVKKLSLVSLSASGLETLLTLPSEENLSLPGLTCVGDSLWISYVSFHEGPGAVYLAHIQLPRWSGHWGNEKEEA